MNKIINLLNDKVLREALPKCIQTRARSDVNASAGSEFEMALADVLNEFLKESKSSLRVFTKKELNSYNSQFGITNYNFKLFMNEVNNNIFSIYYASDLFLVDKNARTIEDAISLKTSIKKDKSTPCLVNDPKGILFDFIKFAQENNFDKQVCYSHFGINQTFIGQILLCCGSLSKNDYDFSFYYFDQEFWDFIVNCNSLNASIFVDQDLTINIPWKTRKGWKTKQVVTVASRGTDKKRKDGKSKKSTSFDRGVNFRNGFEKKILNKIYSFSICFSTIEKDNLNKILED